MIAFVTEEERGTRFPTRLVAGRIVGFAGSWNIANIGALAPGLARHYDTSLGSIGLFTAANFMGEVAAMVPGGALIDRLGAKRVGLAGLVVCAAGNAVLLSPGGVALAAPSRSSRFARRPRVRSAQVLL